MLQELAIRNFAIIEELDVSFCNGLNILSGETGAGKSIIVGALEMLLGSRASVDYIRTGADKASINAIFAIANRQKVKDKLDELGIGHDGNELLLTREISRTGANRVRINGQVTTLSLFKKISPLLIDIHGQHEHQSLFSREEQRVLLDELAGAESLNLLAEVGAIFHSWQEKKNKLAELLANEADRNARLELLAYQIEELEKTDLKPSEEEELTARHLVLSNAERLYNGTQAIFLALSGDNLDESVLQNIALMMKELEGFQKIDPQLASCHTQITNVYYQLQELAEELRIYADKIFFDEAELKKVEDRLGEINRLKRKYGPTVEKVLEYYANIKKEVAGLQDSSRELGALQEDIDRLAGLYGEKAARLSQMRRQIALTFAAELKKQLHDLAMPQVEFEVAFEKTSSDEGIEVDGKMVRPYSWGIDRIEFLLSPNPGENLKPLQKIASGGEISRIMLAIKSIVADSDQVATMVFDEIDSGIGGNTAQKVAERLARIGSKRQVICITHLPQIASIADEHFLIAKEIEAGLTKTAVASIKDEARIKEIARMLGGEMSPASIFHAQEMIERAWELKEIKT